MGLALAVPLFGASLEFAFFEPVLVYAANGWALVVGARLKLVRGSERSENSVEINIDILVCILRLSCVFGRHFELLLLVL